MLPSLHSRRTESCLEGNHFHRYWVLLLTFWSLPTIVWSLPWHSPIATTGNYQQKTLTKLSEKPQRFVKEHFCSILEYILNDHFDQDEDPFATKHYSLASIPLEVCFYQLDFDESTSTKPNQYKNVCWGVVAQLYHI